MFDFMPIDFLPLAIILTLVAAVWVFKLNHNDVVEITIAAAWSAFIGLGFLFWGHFDDVSKTKAKIVQVQETQKAITDNQLLIYEKQMKILEAVSAKDDVLGLDVSEPSKSFDPS